MAIEMTTERWASLFEYVGVNDVNDVRFSYMESPCIIPDSEKRGEFIVFIPTDQYDERWAEPGFWEEVQHKLRPYPIWQI